MVFKLVRVDTEESNKIQLPIGTHLIGRHSCLDCDDKRISRNHGRLIVTENSLVVEALHQNPCFFTKKGSKDIEILRKSSKETLLSGDKFGLLPGSYWYEVLFCPPETDSQATDISNTEEEVSEPEKTIESKPNESDSKPNNKNDPADEQDGQSDETIQDRDENKEISNADENLEFLDFDLNETVENVRAESPSLLDKEQAATDNQPTANPETSPNTTIEPVPDQPDDPQPSTTEPGQPQSPSPKRTHSPETTDDEGAKKIKIEPNDVKDGPVDDKDGPIVKQEPDDVKAGPSNNQAGASNSAADAAKAPPSPAKPPNRERCLYGANCYRRNPQHKAQFSHPTDADWGSGDRAACPYGASCRKRDPRHWHIHDHPPGTHPPPPVRDQRPRPKPRKQRVRSESESDSGSPSRLIVQGKRPRKPIPKDSPGSESEPEDPFNSDGSEDWEPPTNYTESQDLISC